MDYVIVDDEPELEIDAPVEVIKKTIRTTNTGCHAHVRALNPFKASNIYAEWTNGRYVVYSYGSHFPMYIYDPQTQRWYGNVDKYSQSTSKHQSQARPREVDIQWHTSKIMRGIVVRGVAELVARRMAA